MQIGATYECSLSPPLRHIMLYMVCGLQTKVGEELYNMLYIMLVTCFPLTSVIQVQTHEAFVAVLLTFSVNICVGCIFRRV